MLVVSGPTAYTIKDDALKTAARAAAYMGKPTGKRTSDVTSDTPGPGQYDVSSIELLGIAEYGQSTMYFSQR